MKRILINSGGGCKGYAQAQVLKKLEIDNGPLYRYYDLDCGSSVGAINGGIIASGKITMVELESIYPSMIRKVFERKYLPPIPLYNRKHFIEIFASEIGMIKMADCLTKLQITSVNLCDKRNHFFKSWEQKDGQEYLVSTVCKSFAAPFYFGTLADESSKSVWMDGGMGVANIPIAYGLAEAFMLWPDEDWHFDIIGCGFSDETISFKEAKKYKFVRQILSYLDFDDGGLGRGQVRQEQVYGLQALCKASKKKKITMRYFDIAIPKSIDKLDGVKFLNQYKRVGEEMAKKPLIEA